MVWVMKEKQLIKELLEACKAAEKHYLPNPVLFQLRAAIEKATEATATEREKRVAAGDWRAYYETE